MKNKKTNRKLIDNVTTKNLDMALRMCHINLDITIIDHIIDLVELIEIKGDNTSIKDISILECEWDKHERTDFYIKR